MDVEEKEEKVTYENQVTCQLVYLKSGTVQQKPEAQLSPETWVSSFIATSFFPRLRIINEASASRPALPTYTATSVISGDLPGL